MLNFNPALIIQARMSSKRFPGKVLAQLQGRPIIEHVVNSAKQVGLPYFVLTSKHISDEPLARHIEALGVNVFRGDLDDVLGRFRDFVNQSSFSHLIRISADSPLLHPEVVQMVLSLEGGLSADVLTNVYPRTFPKGESIEVLKSALLDKLISFPLNRQHHEHVTSYVYENPEQFSLVNCFNDRDLSHINLCVDYPDDLIRMEKMLGESSISIFDGMPPWQDLSDLITSRSW